MYDQDFQDWVNSMPIGFMHFLWNQYLLSVKAENSSFPLSGDNFIRIDEFQNPLVYQQRVEPLLKPPITSDEIYQFARELGLDGFVASNIVDKKIRREES